ncbi:MAG: Tol-Pal system subunit TolQ, partial [Deltaproteobacteria bacterium]
MPGDLDIIHMVRNAGLMVQMVLLLLLFFSITSWAIILIKYRYIRKAYRESAFFTDIFWESRDLAVAFKEAEELHGSPVARIFRIGYVELKKLSQSGTLNPSVQEAATLGGRLGGTENVKRSLNRAINTEVTRMTQMIPFLATTGNTTPFIGL